MNKMNTFGKAIIHYNKMKMNIFEKSISLHNKKKTIRRSSFILCLMLILASVSGCGEGISVTEELTEAKPTEEAAGTEEIDTTEEVAVSTEEDSQTEETASEETGSSEASTEQGGSDNTDTTSDQNAGNTVTTEEDIARKECFTRILWKIHNTFTLPDGTDLSAEIGDYSTIEDNKFAVYDVDYDGEEELVFSFSTSSMAGMREIIYGYDAEKDDVYVEGSVFPATTYYEGGYLKVGASHNQGKAGSFWPYYLYKYNPDTKEYEEFAFIDAWDGNMFDDDEYPGNKFPSEYDKDGDKMLYYIYDQELGYGMYSDDAPEPVDIDVLNEWTDNEYGAYAWELDVPYSHLVEGSIEEYEQGDSKTTELDPSKYMELQIRAMKFYVPIEFKEKVRIEENGDTITFYYDRSDEVMDSIYNFDFETDCTLFSVMAYDGYDYSEWPSYKYLGSSDILGDGKYYTYLLITPTDVQCVTEYDYDSAVEAGVDITKEELKEISDEYGELFSACQDLHEKFDK